MSCHNMTMLQQTLQLGATNIYKNILLQKFYPPPTTFAAAPARVAFVASPRRCVSVADAEDGIKFNRIATTNSAKNFSRYEFQNCCNSCGCCCCCWAARVQQSAWKVFSSEKIIILECFYAALPHRTLPPNAKVLSTITRTTAAAMSAQRRLRCGFNSLGLNAVSQGAFYGPWIFMWQVVVRPSGAESPQAPSASKFSAVECCMAERTSGVALK